MKAIKPEFGSHLVQTCYQLHKKPLKEFTAEDLRIMVGQKQGLKYLIPLAVDLLDKNPLISGDYFPGDLLCSVARVQSDFWKTESALRERIGKLIDLAIPQLKNDEKTQKELKELREKFR